MKNLWIAVAWACFEFSGTLMLAYSLGKPFDGSPMVLVIMLPVIIIGGVHTFMRADERAAKE